MWIGKVSDRKVSRSLGVLPSIVGGRCEPVDWEYILADLRHQSLSNISPAAPTTQRHTQVDTSDDIYVHTSVH